MDLTQVTVAARTVAVVGFGLLLGAVSCQDDERDSGLEPLATGDLPVLDVQVEILEGEYALSPLYTNGNSYVGITESDPSAIKYVERSSDSQWVVRSPGLQQDRRSPYFSYGARSTLFRDEQDPAGPIWYRVTVDGVAPFSPSATEAEDLKTYTVSSSAIGGMLGYVPRVDTVDATVAHTLDLYWVAEGTTTDLYFGTVPTQPDAVTPVLFAADGERLIGILVSDESEARDKNPRLCYCVRTTGCAVYELDVPVDENERFRLLSSRGAFFEGGVYQFASRPNHEDGSISSYIARLDIDELEAGNFTVSPAIERLPYLFSGESDKANSLRGQSLERLTQYTGDVGRSVVFEWTPGGLTRQERHHDYLTVSYRLLGQFGESIYFESGIGEVVELDAITYEGKRRFRLGGLTCHSSTILSAIDVSFVTDDGRLILMGSLNNCRNGNRTFRAEIDLTQ